MQYKYYSKESRIIDLLEFPKLIEFRKRINEETQINNYTEMIPLESLNMFYDMEDSIKEYEKEISKFYFQESSLPGLIYKIYSPFGFENIYDYLEYIQGLSEKQLLESYLSKLYSLSNNNKLVEKDMIYELMDDTNAQINLLEQIPFCDDEKWKLSKILRQPKEMSIQWINLIKSIEPLFNEYYYSREDEINQLGNRIVENLNNSGGDALAQMSNNMVKKDLLPNGNILISFIDSYSIELNTSSSTNYLRWGLGVEELISSINSAKEGELKERVLLFKNLGDKTRYEVVRLIAQGVESAKEIAEILNVTQATISYHIGNLTTSRLVYLDKTEGSYNYKINFELLEVAYSNMLLDFKYKKE